MGFFTSTECKKETKTKLKKQENLCRLSFFFFPLCVKKKECGKLVIKTKKKQYFGYEAAPKSILYRSSLSVESCINNFNYTIKPPELPPPVPK